jgi:hypothetical protein
MVRLTNPIRVRTTSVRPQGSVANRLNTELKATKVSLTQQFYRVTRMKREHVMEDE